MTIQEYFGDWSRVVDLREADRIVKILSTSPIRICPKLKNIFEAFRVCQYNNLRVVILGQDPYPNLRNDSPVATGIAFANAKETSEKSYSSSLEILRNSVIDFSIPHNFINFDPSLESWEEQGVLLLNTALTCEVNKPGSHTLLWRSFMKSFLTNLSERTVGIVYVLLGNAAGSYESYITKDYNYILKCKHPSYYARTGTDMPSELWRHINKILIDINGYGIEWYQEFKE